MILPQTYLGSLMLMIASLLCLGIWANSYKLGGTWRFELYYFDFAIGLGIAAIVFALTTGNLGFDGFSIMDDLDHAGKRNWMLAFVAGAIFNLANMLLLASVSVAGLAVAFPIAMGFSLLEAILIAILSGNTSSPVNIAVGCALVLLAIVFAALSYSSLVNRRYLAARKEGKKVGHPGTLKGVLLAVVGGLLMGSFPPLLNQARAGDIGVGPYSMMLLFAIGVGVSTFIYNMFFLNLPVAGEPLELRDFFVQPKLHLLGLVGGILWCIGALSNFVQQTAQPEVQVSAGTGLWLSHADALIAALCGLLIWREFRGSGAREKVMAAVAILCFAGGLALFSMAIQAPRPA